MSKLKSGLPILVLVLAVCIVVSLWIARRPPPVRPDEATSGQSATKSNASARLSSEEAIAIAQDKLRKLGRNPEEFNRPDVHYSADDGQWGVTFWPKSRIPDADVFVIIDDKAGQVTGGSHGLMPFE